MKPKRKWIVRSVLTVLIAGLGYLVWALAMIPRILHDCYGQWVTAELVIDHHKDHGSFPTNWQELEADYGDGKGLHHGGMSFTQVRQRMVVEFGRLAELQSLAQGTSSVTALPEIIYTRSGRQTHWGGAEPNRMVYEYLQERQRELPADKLEPKRD